MFSLFSNLWPVASAMTTIAVSSGSLRLSNSDSHRDSPNQSNPTNPVDTYTSKHHLLDPYACMCRLAQLSFLPESTLLEFHDNGIVFHLPDAFQSIKRTNANFWGRHASQSKLPNIRVPLEQAV